MHVNVGVCMMHLCVCYGFVYMCIHISDRGSMLRVAECFLNAGGN